jgi:excisionase family DNA binding protein
MAEGEYMRVGEARELLGINKVRMAKFIADGTLPAYKHGADARVKWLRREDVLKLKASLEAFQPFPPKVIDAPAA